MKVCTAKLLGLIFVTIALITSCNSGVNKVDKQEGEIKVGNIEGERNTELTISLSEAAKLMEKHNRLEDDWFNYTYTRAWIEIIQTEQNNYSYYLGLEASLKSKNNERAYSCYSVYSELSIVKNVLNFHPDAVQHSCKGKCCDNCKLVLFKNGLDCNCATPSEDSGCDDKGNCSHNISRVMDDRQKKNDII